MADPYSESVSEQPLPPPPLVDDEGPREPSRSVNRDATVRRILELEEAGRKGGSWFYWVAALSVLNSLLMNGGVATYFVMGLGVTLSVDMVARVGGEENPDLVNILRVAAIVFALVVAGVVSLFGWVARKGYLSIYGFGMFLYLCDGLLFLLYNDGMSVLFHGFALFWMWSGFSAFRQARAIERELQHRLEEAEERGAAD
jgi:hypothetical protein